jgi:hypothetical protein
VPDAPYARVSVQAPEESVSSFTTDKKIHLPKAAMLAGTTPRRRPGITHDKCSYFPPCPDLPGAMELTDTTHVVSPTAGLIPLPPPAALMLGRRSRERAAPFFAA